MHNILYYVYFNSLQNFIILNYYYITRMQERFFKLIFYEGT